jgi:hypothetical protein
MPAYPTLTPAPDAAALAAYRAWYESLPQHYRDADASLGWPLYKWLAGVGIEYGKVAALIEDIDYVTPDDGGAPGDTSTLTDPSVAPVAWLPWIAQLVGVPLRADLTDAEKRDAIAFASAGWRAGTKTAVADAAKTELTGTRFARVYDHSIFDPGDGGEWDVLIITRNSETPDPARVLTAVSRRAAKPAGVMLYHRAYEASWDTVSATYPTWAAIDATGRWDAVQEAGL